MPPKPPWFKQHPIIAVFLFTTALIVLIFTVVETGLRWKGYQPGYLTINQHFNFVDSLEVERDYVADEFGINTVDPQLRDSFYHHIALIRQDLNNIFDVPLQSGLQDWVREYGLMGIDQQWIDDFVTAYLDKKNDSLYGPELQSMEILQASDNVFHQNISNIKSKPSKDVIDSAYLDYAHHLINEQGFRSIPFKNYESNNIKVLLLGDSFTWGLSAKPLTTSFPDLLAAKGLVVYNTGIIGADPAQYLAVAKKYIPLLQPDAVVVNFFSENDVMYFKRAMKPNQLHYYATNAGWLWSCPKQEYLPSPEFAYRYYEEHFRIPKIDGYWWNDWLSKTVITTKLWQVLASNFVIKGYSESVLAYDERNRNYFREESVSNEYLMEINRITSKNHAKFLVSIIPGPDNLAVNCQELGIGDSYPCVKAPFTLEHYASKPDLHFNNNGHSFYAEFLENQILELVNNNKQ